MAISITNSSASISTGSTGVYAYYSGKLSYTTVTAYILINGTTVSSASYSGTSSSGSIYLNISNNLSSIFSAADGHSLSGAVTLRVIEFNGGSQIGSSSKTGGYLTISQRLSSLGWSATPSPFSLDSTGSNLSATWVRPHTAFRGRLKVYVNGTLVINRYGYGTSANFNPYSLGYWTGMINAMNFGSPRELKFELITQFNASSIVDLNSVGLTITRSTGITRNFATLAITNSSASINDSTLSYSLTFNSRATTSSTGKVVGYILVNGTQIGSAESTTATSSISVSYTAANLYSAASGSSLSGAVTFRVREYTSGGTLLKTSDKTGGNVSITASLSNFSWSTMANPFNLDSPTNIIASWSRPHTAFRGRHRLYVNGVLIRDLYGLTTGANYASTSYVSAMITAMDNVSPREIKYILDTRFDDGTTNGVASSASSLTLTRSTGIIKNFYAASTISSFANFTIGSNPSVTLIKNSGPTVYHRMWFKVGSTSGTLIKTVDWSSTTSGTISLTSGEWGTIINGLSGTAVSLTVSLQVATYQNSNYTTQIGSTQSTTATATTSASTISDADIIEIERASTGGFTISSSYSGYTHSARYKIGSTIIRTVTSGATLTLTNEEKAIIYNAFGHTDSSIDILIELDTYYGAKQIGTTDVDVTGAFVLEHLFDAGGATTLALSDKTLSPVSVVLNGSLFTYDLIIRLGGTLIATFTELSGAQFSPTLTLAQQEVIYNAVTNANSATLLFESQRKYLTKQIGDSVFDETLVYFPALKPSCGTPTHIKSASSINDLAYYVQNLTRLEVTIPTVSTMYGATITSATLSIDGKSYAVSSPSYTSTTDNLTSSSTTSGLTLTATLIDSRGQTYSDSTSVIVHPYATPVISSFTVGRSDIAGVSGPVGEYLKVNYNTSITPLPSSANADNSITIKVYTKLTSTSTWSTTPVETYTPVGTSANTFGVISGYPIFDAYSVKIELIDRFTTVTSTIRTLATGKVPFSMSETGIGIGKLHQYGALDVAGDIYMTGILQSGSVPWARISDAPDFLSATGGTITGPLYTTDVLLWQVSDVDEAKQRADARDDDTTFARLHWYGVSDTGATSNFRHAWFDGASYINVTADSGRVTFSGQVSATALYEGTTAISSKYAASSHTHGAHEVTVLGNYLSVDSDGKVRVNNTGARRAGMYGTYDSYKIGHVWSMGSAYQINSGGDDFGNLYGMAYKHTNNTTGGTMAGGHQIVFTSAGTPGTAIGLAGGIWTSGTIVKKSSLNVPGVFIQTTTPTATQTGDIWFKV